MTRRTKTAVAAGVVVLLVSGWVPAPAMAQPAPLAGDSVPPGPERPGQRDKIDNEARGDSGTPRAAPATTVPSGLPPLRDDQGPTAQQQTAISVAVAKAHTTGKPVTIDALTDETDLVVAQPHGGLSLEANTLPVRTLQRGMWVKVDTTLRRNGDGTLSPVATAYGTVRFSGGGSGPLLTTSSGATSYTLFWPSALPHPAVSGSSATYRSVFPGVDLVVTATDTGGFQEVLVVHDAAAAKNPGLTRLALPSKVAGGRLQGDTQDGFAVTGARDVLETSTPLMWDSGTGTPTARVAPDKSDPYHPGAAARIAVVGARDDGKALHLDPDTALLDDARTTYPVYIDPTANWHPAGPSAAPAFDEVKQGSPCNHVSLYNNTSNAGDNGFLAVGAQLWNSDCAGLMRTYYQWRLPSVIWHSHIKTANINATEMYSATCGKLANATVNLHWAGAINSKTDWNNQPGYAGTFNTGITFGDSYNPTYCPNNGTESHSFDVASLLAQAAKQSWASLAVALAEDALEKSRDKNGFKRFTNNPTMQITFDRPPVTPGTTALNAVSGSHNAACDIAPPYPYMGKTITTNTPVLSAKVSDPDGDSVQTSFKYWIDGSTTSTTALSGDNMASGSTTKYSLPASFVSSLTNGKTVDWQALVYDGMEYSNWSPICHFTAEPTAPDPPTIVSVNNLYPDIDHDGATGAAAGTAGSFTLTGTGTTVTKFYFNIDVPPSMVNPPASQVITAASNSAQVVVTPRAPGPHTLWAAAVDAAGDVSATQAYRFIAAGDPNTTCASLAACVNNDAITADTKMNVGGADTFGDSFSATDLTNAGWTSGGHVTVNGATFTLPAFGNDQNDNVLAANQTITYNYAVPTSGLSSLNILATSTDALFADPGVLANDATAPFVPGGTGVTGQYCFDGTDASAYCPAQGTITYTDGTVRPYYLTVPDWITGPANLATFSLPHENYTTGQNSTNHPKMYPFSVPLLAGKTMASVTLPDIGDVATGPGGRLHIFSLATRNTTVATTTADGGSTAAPTGKAWTGLWASPMESVAGEGNHYTNMTVRTRIWPDMNGDTVRIKLENSLNSTPLVTSHTTIGQPQGGVDATLAATPTDLTFGGNKSVTIPEGGMVYSDPISWGVTYGGSGVVVSLSISNAPPYVPVNPWATNRSWTWESPSNSGDHTTDTVSTAFTASGSSSGSFTAVLTDMDVLSDGIPTQVTYGNGIIDPGQTNAHADPEAIDLSENLGVVGPSTSHAYSAVSGSTAGEYLTVDDARGYQEPSAMSRVDRDLLSVPNLSATLIDQGLEDVLNRVTGTNAGETIDTETVVENDYSQLLTYLNTGQFNQVDTDVIAVGLQPCDGYPGGGNADPCTTDADTDRQAVNDWLKNAPDPSMYYVNTDAAIGLDDSSAGEKTIKSSYQTGDHVNLNDDGYGELTNAFLGPHDTWSMNDGADDPTTTLLSDTASNEVNPQLSIDPTVGANPADLNGDATWTADGTMGEALNTGTTGGAYTDGAPIDTSHSFTVMAWIKLTDDTTDHPVITQQDVNGTGFQLSWDHAAEAWKFTLARNTSTNPSYTTVWSQPAGNQVNTWAHIVAMYDKTNHHLFIEAEHGTTWPWGYQYDDQLNPPTSNGSLDIGFASDGSHFTGLISDLQAFDYPLAEKQLDGLYDERA